MRDDSPVSSGDPQWAVRIRRILLGLAVFFILTGAVAGLTIRRAEARDLDTVVEMVANVAANEVDQAVAARLTALERMAERQARLAPGGLDVWRADATLHFRDFDDFESLLLLDSVGERLLATVPESDPELQEILRGRARRALPAGTFSVGAPFLHQGRLLISVLAAAPEARGPVVAALLEPRTTFETVFDWLDGLGFESGVRGQEEWLHGSPDRLADATVSRRIDTRGGPLTVSVAPGPGVLERELTILPWVIGITGLLLGLAAAVGAVTAGRVARTQSRMAAIEADRKALREERNRFFELNPSLLCIVDTDGRFVSLSNAWESTLGYSLEELEGAPFLSFVHPEDRERTREAAAELDEGGALLDFENRYLDQEGHVHWLQWRSAADPERSLIYAAARDVTTRRKLEEELKEERRALIRSNAELEQFASVASHDLQEPLRTITSYVQLLDRRYGESLEGDAEEFMEFIRDGAQRMKTLINDLLELSRITTRGEDRVPVDSGAAVDRALRDLRTSIEERDARIEHDELPTVLADPGQLAQLFQNLVGNAMKFSPEVPEIRIAAEPAGDGLFRFTVADRGIGIEPRFHDRIFTLFQRLGSRQESSGTGIGLTICKRIVERHGGEIGVEARPGGGSIFWFTLPGASSSVDAHGAPPAALHAGIDSEETT